MSRAARFWPTLVTIALVLFGGYYVAPVLVGFLLALLLPPGGVRASAVDAVVTILVASSVPLFAAACLAKWEGGSLRKLLVTLPTVRMREVLFAALGVLTGAINYGGDTGIIINRCGKCDGIWLDTGELANIQMLVQAWKDNLPADLRKHGPRLDEVAAELEASNKVVVSQLPLVAGFINAAINGILDIGL